jgi:hypothetical protein
MFNLSQMSQSEEAIRREYMGKREQISSIAQKIAELDQDRNEHEYVGVMPHISPRSALCSRWYATRFSFCLASISTSSLTLAFLS